MSPLMPFHHHCADTQQFSCFQYTCDGVDVDSTGCLYVYKNMIYISLFLGRPNKGVLSIVLPLLNYRLFPEAQ